MKIIRVHAGLCLLVIALLSAAVSGCGGGWGDAKPAITSTSSSGSNGAGGSSSGNGSQTVTVNDGQPATFSVKAQGTGPFQYQWFLNGQPITGATSASYTLTATTANLNGAVFTVTVSNAAGTVTVGPFTLAVNVPPTITQQPASETVTAGQPASFSVAISGTAPMGYQWSENGAPIPGATSSTLTTPATSISGSGSTFSVAVSNVAGSVTSSVATLTVAPIVPALAFAAVPMQEIYGNAPFAVTAGSASSGAIIYSVVSGPATFSGNMVTLTGTGTVELQASQAASGNYAMATTTVSFTVAEEVPTLAFAPIPAKTYGSPAFPVTASSASSGAVSYTVASGPATITGNTVTLTGVGTVELQASQAASGNYAAATATTSFNVAAEVPTMAFASIPAETYGNPAFPVTASSASSGAVTYTVASGPATISGDMVTLTGTGTVVLNASQAAAGNYAAATTTTSFNVAREVPTLAFAPIPPETYGNAAFAVSASSASSGAVTYTVASGPATIVGNTVTLTGIGTVVLNASQAAAGNYAAATATTSFNVAAEVPTLAFASIPPETYGNPAFAVSASSASSGTITYSVLSGNATISGSTVTLTGIGPVELEASQAANGNYAAATTTVSFNVVAEVPTLTFTSLPTETAYTPFTVSASSTSSGTITYSVYSGPATISGNTVTPTAAGTVVIEASQAASGNYAAATSKTNITVGNSTPIAASLVGSSSTPGYGASINLTPTFSGGTALVGSSGPGSSDITASAVSGASYATPAITTSKTYTLTVTGSGGNTATATFTVTPSTVTISAITPANQTTAPGTVNFSGTASGGSTDQLTWTASGGSITSGGVWTAPDTPGSYTITATSVDNPAVSVTTTAIVSAPVITAQPTSRNACSGYPVSLSVTANYASSYQWTEGGSIVGTAATLTFSPAATTNSGTYQCTAINGAGNATCNPVVLNISSPTTPQITQPPASVTVYATQTATFSVSATGTGGLSYQWYTGTPSSGTPISGATSSTYTTGALTGADTGTTYYATVTDGNCTGTTLTSSAATLTVSTTDTAVPPTIVVQPQGQSVSVDGEATFSVTASGSGTLSYQWYRVPYGSTGMASTAGIAISGANSSTYTVPTSYTTQSDDGDNYFVVVTNSYGSALSNRVILAVGSGIIMQITGQPQTTYVPATSVASLNVSASCSACTPAYQWYWDAPGTSTPVALTDGALSSGALSGATVIGSATSSLTLENVPATASGSVLYALVTSTSNGATISGTDPLTSNTAGLFVGSLGTVGNAGTNQGLCNSSTVNWVLNGSEGNGATPNTGGTTSGDVPYQNTSACSIELTNDSGGEQAAVYWPTLISTANFTASFTVQVSDTTGSPADGFTMILADPSQGATTASLGAVGEGLGANGIPGLVVGFDTYQNGNANGGNPADCLGCDPITVPYMAVGPGATNLWENPWYFVNGNLNTQNSTDYLEDTGVANDPNDFTNSTHSYVVSVVSGVMTVTMDGYELFTGTVNLPPVAYLGFTASTGGSMEAVTFSDMNATVSAP